MSVQNAGESFVLFELAGATYGVRSSAVQQMDMVEALTPVPNAPPFVDGIVFLRGRVVPAINLRTRFGFQPRPIDLRTRLVVLNSEGRTVGLIVDSAREFVRFPETVIQPPPEAIAGLSGRFLEGIASLNERLVLILDTEAVLAAPESQAAAELSAPA